jgi:hypothetical protein
MTGAQVFQGAFKAAVSIAAYLSVSLLTDIKEGQRATLERLQTVSVEQAIGKAERVELRSDIDDVTVRVGHVEVGLAEVKAACAALRHRPEMKPGR